MSNDIDKAVNRARGDQAYKAKLLRDPHAALEEEGVEFPDGVEVKVVENSAATVYLVLPEDPEDDLGLTADELERVARDISPEMFACLPMASRAHH